MSTGQGRRGGEAGNTRLVVVNGESRSLPTGITVGGLLESMDRDPRTVAVELNGSIVPRERYDFVALQEGDRLEIVHFVQGG